MVDNVVGVPLLFGEQLRRRLVLMFICTLRYVCVYHCGGSVAVVRRPFEFLRVVRSCSTDRFCIYTCSVLPVVLCKKCDELLVKQVPLSAFIPLRATRSSRRAYTFLARGVF
jgi:hypothetical protein